jgi:sarcosine oxidase subunit beta
VRRIEVEAGRLVGVQTDSDTISTTIVVVAAGAWTPALLRDAGLVLPVTPMRTQVAIFTWPQAATPIRFMSINDYINGCYFAYDGPDARHVIVGLGERGRAPLDDLRGCDEVGDVEYAQRARECLVTRVPLATYIDNRGGWAGPITVTDDGLPVIDRHPEVAGLFFATGCNGGGFKSSPAVGRALAEWATTGAPEVVELTPFHADRFTRPHGAQATASLIR